eukprot:scaffold6649_cov124-Isochrysis_galbana.AAC.4
MAAVWCKNGMDLLPHLGTIQHIEQAHDSRSRSRWGPRMQGAFWVGDDQVSSLERISACPEVQIVLAEARHAVVERATDWHSPAAHIRAE